LPVSRRIIGGQREEEEAKSTAVWHSAVRFHSVSAAPWALSVGVTDAGIPLCLQTDGRSVGQQWRSEPQRATRIPCLSAHSASSPASPPSRCAACRPARCCCCCSVAAPLTAPKKHAQNNAGHNETQLQWMYLKSIHYSMVRV
jgi:hypothetical protein